MDVMSFIRDNYKWLIEVCLLVVTFLTLIFKKKVKIVNVMALLLKRLPEFIIDAENTGLKGPAKYSMVFSSCIKYLVTLTGLSADDVANRYSVQIDEAIENILNCPQKKGEKKDEI